MFRARNVVVGGKSKEQIRRELALAEVRLNALAEALFEDPRFTVSESPHEVECFAVSIASLGHPVGAAIAEACQSADQMGLSECPLELAAHLRLQYTDQAEGAVGFPHSKHGAPPGSITVVSPALSPEYETPKGFYLRRIEGRLWLRGYRSEPDHVWSPEDVLVFCRGGATDSTRLRADPGVVRRRDTDS